MGWLRDFFTGPTELTIDREPMIERVAPIEGTRMSLFNSQIPSFFEQSGMTSGSWMPGDAGLVDRVWVADRCVQLNAQQVATMPLVYHGTDEPLWVSNPDPNLFPNGIGDAMFDIVKQIYGWGFSCQYVTGFYADGRPRNWTVLNSGSLNVKFEDGARVYEYGETILDASRVIQIDRNPSGSRARGTSALRAYAQVAYGLLAAGNQSQAVNDGGIPQAVIKADANLTEEQARKIQEKWMEPRPSGSPRVLDKNLNFLPLSFDPSDMALLETQEFNAKAIMTAFGVPATLLNMALQGGLTYQNPAALGEQWWRFELRCLATRIVNAFTAQMLPRGQWISVDAADTFAPLTELSDDDDEQLSQVAKASPAQQPGRLSAVGG